MKQNASLFIKFLHLVIIHASVKQKRKNKYTTGVVLEWLPDLNRGAFLFMN